MGDITQVTPHVYAGAYTWDTHAYKILYSETKNSLSEAQRLVTAFIIKCALLP